MALAGANCGRKGFRGFKAALAALAVKESWRRASKLSARKEIQVYRFSRVNIIQPWPALTSLNQPYPRDAKFRDVNTPKVRNRQSLYVMDSDRQLNDQS